MAVWIPSEGRLGCVLRWRHAAIAANPADAETLADAVLSHQLADDVLALSTTDWDRLRCSQDPYWEAIDRNVRILAKG